MSSSTTTRRANGTSASAKNGKAKRAGNGAHAKPCAEDVASAQSSRHGKATWFTAFAQKTSQLAGRPGTFILATAIIVIWGITGPLFGYSDTWQLVINTGTTIVTFLMVS